MKPKGLRVFSVILRGENDGRHFLTMVDVVGSSFNEAQKLALSEAAKLGLNITEIEEVEESQDATTQSYLNVPGVLKVYGKAYFDLED